MAEDKQTLIKQEDAALAAMAQQGSAGALDKLVRRHTGFVVNLAKEYQGRGVELDDLVSEGSIALLNAIRKWNPEKTESLVGYAVYDIRKAMERAVEREANVVRVPVGEDGHVKSMDAPLRPGHTRTLGEAMPQNDQANADDSADDSADLLFVERGLKHLSEREREVIASFYGIGRPHLTMAEIGEEMNLKRERVRQIRKKAERKLRH